MCKYTAVLLLVDTFLCICFYTLYPFPSHAPITRHASKPPFPIPPSFTSTLPQPLPCQYFLLVLPSYIIVPYHSSPYPFLIPSCIFHTISLSHASLPYPSPVFLFHTPLPYPSSILSRPIARLILLPISLPFLYQLFISPSPIPSLITPSHTPHTSPTPFLTSLIPPLLYLVLPYLPDLTYFIPLTYHHPLVRSDHRHSKLFCSSFQDSSHLTLLLCQHVVEVQRSYFGQIFKFCFTPHHTFSSLTLGLGSY